MTLTAERLRSLFRYEPEQGRFIRLSARGKFAAGTVLEGTLSHGYLRAMVDGKQYPIHRLAVLWMTGKWPANDVDHIDGSRTNNKWANLRDVPRAINLQNIRKATSRTHTGLLGAFPHGKNFRARIRLNGKNVNLGTYKTAEEAHQRYVQAKRQLHEGSTL